MGSASRSGDTACFDSDNVPLDDPTLPRRGAQGESYGPSRAPLDWPTVTESAGRMGRLLVIDQDYRAFGLSGELPATVLEAARALSR
jgi:hypothetical protein